MLIHLVTDRFSIGGGIEHIFQVVGGLTDFQFRVFGLPGPAVEKFKNLSNVEIHDNGYHPSEVAANRPDVIHFHHLKPLVHFFKNHFFFNFHPASRVPVIYTAHGLHIHKYEFYHALTAKLKYKLRFHLEKRVLSKARRVIAVSEEDRLFLEKEYGLTQVTYLTNGIDFSKFESVRNTKEELRAKLGFPSEAFLFVTAARFNFQKGYDILVKAAASIAEDLEKIKRGVRFVCVGDGEEFDAVKRMSQDLGVSKYMIFLGTRTGSDVYEIIKASDVFLLPSRWEGLPFVLMEAGMLNVPVLASDTYGNREILKTPDGMNGILFPNMDTGILGKTILNVLRGEYNLEEYALNLHREVRTHYNLPRMIGGLREMYTSSTSN